MGDKNGKNSVQPEKIGNCEGYRGARREGERIILSFLLRIRQSGTGAPAALPKESNVLFTNVHQ